MHEHTELGRCREVRLRMLRRAILGLHDFGFDSYEGVTDHCCGLRQEPSLPVLTQSQTPRGLHQDLNPT
jgi:hypothetical protein